jgi:antitoxin MazE
MSKATRTRIIKIGNSQGIRIPKILLEQSGIDTEVEIEVDGDRLIVRTASGLRSGWEKSFALMAECNDDRLLDNATVTDWDRNDWEW